jgi:hypothetical protein
MDKKTIMNASTCLRVAGVLAALAVIAIGAINGITMQLNRPVTVSLFLLAIAVGLLLSAPSLVKPSISSDGPALALIGPTSVLCVVLIVLSASTLYLAGNNAKASTVWSLDVMYGAIVLIGLAMLVASRSVVVAASGSDHLAPPHPDPDHW